MAQHEIEVRFVPIADTPSPEHQALITLALVSTYCADKGTSWTFTTGGGFHLPVSASDFGA